MKRLLPLLPVLLSAILSGCKGAAREVNQYANAPLTASGFLEVETVSIVSEVSGRVEAVNAEEGQSVNAGDVLIVLDDSMLQAQREQAKAAVSIATANLQHLEDGATEEELASASADVDNAMASLQSLQISAGAAWQAADHPADIQAQIAAAQIEADLAFQQIGILESQIAEQQFMIDLLRADNRDIDRPRIENEERLLAILIARKTAAETEYQGAQRKLEALNQQLEHPLALIAQARSFSSQIPVAQLGVELAQAQYDLVANGASKNEIAIASAQLRIAEAQVALIDAQIAQLTLVSPIDGVITTRSIHAGETASAGFVLLSVADLKTLRLIAYIPEPQIGRVHLGATVELTVDAYPMRTFTGVVSAIANEAEFTPRSVQTAEDRVDLVFAVEITFSNEDGLLKAGMPADIVILE